jgi:hypothetical protein
MRKHLMREILHLHDLQVFLLNKEKLLPPIGNNCQGLSTNFVLS